MGKHETLVQKMTELETDVGNALWKIQDMDNTESTIELCHAILELIDEIRIMTKGE